MNGSAGHSPLARKIRRFVLIPLGCFGVLLVAGVAFEQWSRWQAPRVFSPPGELVEVNGKRTHLYCTGDGSPTVVLEAGGYSPSAVWQSVQRLVADSTRVCSYDRAGYAWSDRRAGPRDARRIADELHAVLRAASVPAPYVMVGHSMGGPLIQVFTHRYPAEVAGLVFVDVSVPEMVGWDPVEGPSIKRIFLDVVRRVTAETGVLRLLYRRIDLPELPPGVLEVLQAFGSRHVSTASREFEHFDRMLMQAAPLNSFGDRPTIVLSAGSFPDELLQGRHGEAYRARHDRLIEAHAKHASRSAIGEHRVVPDAGHLIPLENPEAVASAILDVMSQVRGHAWARAQQGGAIHITDADGRSRVLFYRSCPCSRAKARPIAAAAATSR